MLHIAQMKMETVPERKYILINTAATKIDSLLE